MQTSLILHFAKQDIIDKYKGSILGVLWNIIMPLTMILIFTFIFSSIMGARLSGFKEQPYAYGIYLISGILFWNLFANIAQRVANVLSEKKGLIKKNRIELETLPIYIIISETIIFIISLFIFAIFLVYIHYPIDLNWLLLLPVYALTILLAYIVGFSVAIFSVFIKDIKEMLTVILQVWFWATPIVYVVDILPKSIGSYYQLNPMYWVVQASHNIILYHESIYWESLLLIVGISSILLLVLVKVSRKLEKDIRDFI